MANLLPTPVAAVLGLVPTVFDGVRRLPGRAVQLPVIAVSNALATMDLLRREYDDLAERGERLIQRLTGRAVDAGTDPLGTVDALEDRIEGVAARTPFGKAYDRTEDALENAVERVKHAGEQAAQTAGKGVQAAGQAAGRTAARAGRAADTAADTLEQTAERVGSAAAETADRAAGAAAQTADRAAGAAAETADRAAGAAAETADRAAGAAAGTADRAAGAAAGTADRAAGAAARTADRAAGTADRAADTAADVPAEERPKGAPTPKASGPDTTRVATAASPSVQQAVEKASADAPGEPLGHDDLPLPDYDHMTLGSLRGRLRSLSVEQLVQLRTYEKAHADRLPIVTMLDNRIAKLATDASAQPSGPVSTSPAPEQLAAGGAQPSRGISPATTTAPTINPPSQGDPTNPAQPR